MATKNEHIQHILSLLPDSPGVYQYFDKEGNIIYVGKAKNLKRRVSSYFNKNHESLRTTILVRNICDIKNTVVKSEEDALHLENSFIKEYKPRYNVLLKDDKTYPWITIRNEHFPRVFLTRKVIHDGSKYYGPYAHVQLARTVLELIRSLFPIRTCPHLLSPENVRKHRYKVCLQYHIKNCKGPCEERQSEEEYLKDIDQIRQILNGNIQQLTDHLKEEMTALAEQMTFTVPQRGDKRKLLEVSEQNVKQYKIDKLKSAEKLNPEQRVTRILSRAQKDFRLHNLPMHIECFDNSNIQGTLPVSSCVVFKKAKPSKKDYRHFNVKTVEGPDDFASMYEAVYRRYKRLSEENQPLPDLVVVDGGKGQLSAACEALRDLQLNLPIIGIAKRLEEIFFPDDPIPLYLDKNSESLRLIQQMRDEAHRFGITHHRNRRSKNQVESALDKIPGVGTKTRDLLLSRYKSVKRIKEVPFEELSQYIGPVKAKLVHEALK